MSRAHLLLPFVIAVASPLAVGHDFWLWPSEFHPTADARITLDLRVGERFTGESVARDPEKFERFVAIDADGKETVVAGQDGKAPAGYLRPSAAGLLCVVYRSRAKSIELEAAKFEAYLAEEGLERVSKLRAERGDSAKPGKESYSRCAKSLLRVGGKSEVTAAETIGFDRRVGLPLEFVPGKDPTRLAPGDRLPVVLLYRDQPLEGALVGATCESHPEEEVRLRTDAAGRVEFVVSRGGPWLVHAVHMVPADAASGADWQSLWVSLTFEPRAAAR